MGRGSHKGDSKTPQQKWSWKFRMERVISIVKLTSAFDRWPCRGGWRVGGCGAFRPLNHKVPSPCWNILPRERPMMPSASPSPGMKGVNGSGWQNWQLPAWRREKRRGEGRREEGDAGGMENGNKWNTDLEARQAHFGQTQTLPHTSCMAVNNRSCQVRL